MMDADTTIARYEGLLNFLAREYFAPGLTHDDMLQEARIGAWKACQDYRPDAGTTFRNFLILCVRRQLITAVKTAQRGKHSTLNTAMSLDAPPPGDDVDVPYADVIAGGVDPAREADARQTLADLAAVPLSDRERTVVFAIAAGETYEQLAERTGLSLKAIDNAAQRARKRLAQGPTATVERGVLLVDRDLHPTRLDAVREARRVRPDCEVLAAEKRKWRRGRVTSTRGRAAGDGYLGRPVWALEIAA